MNGGRQFDFIQWQAVLDAEIERFNQVYSFPMRKDEIILKDVAAGIKSSVNDVSLMKEAGNAPAPRLNVAKVAGIIAFWLTKLKPLQIDNFKTKRYFLFVNEYIAIRVGVAICNLYKWDHSKVEPVDVKPRIMTDWMKSFHYFSHSPHSSMIAFELLASED